MASHSLDTGLVSCYDAPQCMYEASQQVEKCGLFSVLLEEWAWQPVIFSHCPLTVSPIITDDIACPALTNPVNGAVLVDGVTQGSTATYTCNIGYSISGDSVRNCGPDGTWQEPEPSCQSMALSIMMLWLYGHVFPSAISWGDEFRPICQDVFYKYLVMYVISSRPTSLHNVLQKYTAHGGLAKTILQHRLCSLSCVVVTVFGVCNTYIHNHVTLYTDNGIT